jgi:glycogen synthase
VHVLITADTVGGVWTYTRELVCGLLDRGHEVTLVSFGKMPTAAQSSWLVRRKLNYHPTVFPLEWMQHAEDGIIESARHLARIVDQSRPDILHLSQFCYGALAVGIPKVVVAHSDVLSWWNAVHGETPASTPWLEWYSQLVAHGIACADVVVAPSHWMLQTLKTHYDVSAPCQVIHNGRSPHLFLSSTDKTDCVLSVGRVWDEAKQIKLLLAREQCVPVGIAGSPEHPDKRVPDPSATQSGSRCTFWGEQDESHLADLYAKASTYAATSCYEPFGLAPLEAAFSRCALVANDIPVFRELWGDAAFYFARNDADSLAESIRILSRNSLMRGEFADKAYECARNRFTSWRMVGEYEDLYCALTGKATA